MAIAALPPAPPGQGARSTGLSYQELLDTDTRRVPEVLRWQSARELPPARVPIERYTSEAFHRLEVEKVWKKVWQFACREEEIPEVGDHTLYEIADVELLIVRASPTEIRAFRNACLHRGRALKDCEGRSQELRCPFHGWSWNLDGTLKTVPARWDFPHVERERYALPEARVGTWGGFVFVNLDPACVSLETYLGDLPKHFAAWPLEKRYKEAHVAKLLRCNWKVAQEAFMEAYHVIATHPQMLPGIGDCNSQYDAWDHFSRAITANMTPSPHLPGEPGEQEQLDAMFTRSLDAEPMLRVPDGMTARQMLAQVTRMQLQGAVPGIADVSDTELCDSFYYTVFPNFHPWGAYNRIVYRFRPNGNDPHACIMEVIYLAPFRGRRPPPAKVHWLREDQDWTQAPELGFLSRVFNQDTGNLYRVQDGLRSAAHSHVTFAQYQETKARHFHALLERYVGA
jgi:phenylpropionate dioxygenase-like ring-hydroxylating dioxygenase large terminal subunit